MIRPMAFWADLKTMPSFVPLMGPYRSVSWKHCQAAEEEEEGAREAQSERQILSTLPLPIRIARGMTRAARARGAGATFLPSLLSVGKFKRG